MSAAPGPIDLFQHDGEPASGRERDAPPFHAPPVAGRDAEVGPPQNLREDDPHLVHRERHAEAAPVSSTEGEELVRRGPQAEILMTWLEPGETGGRLMFARLSAQTWSQPITVAECVSTLGPED